MLDKLPTSQQMLRTLPDVVNASNEVRGEDYFHLKRDVFNILSFIELIVQAVDDGEFSPQIGTGSPEGVVTANYSLKYIDTSGPTEYYNPTYGAITGWVAL